MRWTRVHYFSLHPPRSAAELCKSSTYSRINFPNMMLKQTFLEAFLKIRFHPVAPEQCSFAPKLSRVSQKSFHTIREQRVLLQVSRWIWEMKARRRVPARGPWGLLSASRAEKH